MIIVSYHFVNSRDEVRPLWRRWGVECQVHAAYFWPRISCNGSCEVIRKGVLGEMSTDFSGQEGQSGGLYFSWSISIVKESYARSHPK